MRRLLLIFTQDSALSTLLLPDRVISEQADFDAAVLHAPFARLVIGDRAAFAKA